MAEIQCFFLEPVAKAIESWRRYRSRRLDNGDQPKCPSSRGYHTARVVGGQINLPLGEREFGRPATESEITTAPWPTACDCGYVFAGDDHYQYNIDRIYKRADTGELMTLRAAPPGAMWYADWMHFKGPDGHALVVKTPAGDWCIDGPSYNNGNRGPGWTRTGTPPMITASPSIGMGKDGRAWAYHAWLRNGVLIDC